MFCIIFDAFLQYFHLLSSFSYMPYLAPIGVSFLWNYYLVYCPLSDWEDKLCSCGWLCCSGTKLHRALLTPLKQLPPVKYEVFWSFCNSFQSSVKLHYCTLPGNWHTYVCMVKVLLFLFIYLFAFWCELPRYGQCTLEWKVEVLYVTIDVQDYHVHLLLARVDIHVCSDEDMCLCIAQHSRIDFPNFMYEECWLWK